MDGQEKWLRMPLENRDRNKCWFHPSLGFFFFSLKWCLSLLKACDADNFLTQISDAVPPCWDPIVSSTAWPILVLRLCCATIGSYQDSNHRTAEASGLAGTSGQCPAPPLPRTRQPQETAQGCIHPSFIISRDRDFTASLSILFQCSATLTIKKKKFLLMFKWNFVYFDLCLLLLLLSLGTVGCSLGPSSLVCP